MDMDAQVEVEVEVSEAVPQDSRVTSEITGDVADGLADKAAPAAPATPLPASSWPPPPTFLLPDAVSDHPLWRSLYASLRETLSPTPQAPIVLKYPPVQASDQRFTLEQSSLGQSLRANLREAFFPSPQAPLVVTSAPLAVKKIWGFYDHTRQGALGSVAAHGLVIGLILLITLWPRTPKVSPPPQASDYTPIALSLPPDLLRAQGGGGGGEHSFTPAPKGALPQTAKLQLTPPRVVPLENPKLPAPPTILADLKTPKLPDLGDPFTKVALAVPSNGTGGQGGIGTGDGTGVGPGSGPGFGPGNGGNHGGGNYSAGHGGVSVPRAIYAPEPEFSEEARRAKYQGVVVLNLIVGADGRAHNVKIQRGLGLGLDEKALEVMKVWRFEPAKLNGAPVAVAVNIEVDFRLY